MSSKTSVISRKDMKEPDKFQHAAEQAAGWVAARKRQAVIAGGAVIALVLLVVVVLVVQSSRAKTTGAAVSQLLETVGGTVSSVPLPGAPGPFFPTEEARQRAIIGAADQLLAQHGGAAAALAALAKGDAHLRLREWDAAKSAYEKYLAAAGRDDSLRFGALEGLALVAEGQGNPAAAADAFARMAKEAPAFADRADLERARVLAAAGKTEEARQVLAAFQEQHKTSPLAPEATQRLGKLGGK
jgi:tetratricopeptide (TPR) repeat protein